MQLTPHTGTETSYPSGVSSDIQDATHTPHGDGNIPVAS